MDIEEFRKNVRENLDLADSYVKNVVGVFSDWLSVVPQSKKNLETEKRVVGNIVDSLAKLRSGYKELYPLLTKDEIFEIGRSMGRVETVELLCGLKLKKKENDSK